MIEAKAAFDAGKAGLGLLDTIIKMVQKAKADGKSLAIADVLQRMPSEAFAIAGEIKKTTEEARQSFLNAKVDLSKSINDLQSDAVWWRYRQYRLVRSFEAKITGLVTACGHLIEDFVSIANCKDADNLVAASFKDAMQMQSKLMEEMNFDKPVGDLFKVLLEHVTRIRADLGDLSQGKS